MTTLEACRRAAEALERFERGDEGDAEWLAEHLDVCPVCAPLGAPLPDATVTALRAPSAPGAAEAGRAPREDDAFFAAQRGAIMDAVLRSGHNARIEAPARQGWASRAASPRRRRASQTRALGMAIAAGIALVALARVLVPASGDEVARQPVQIARQDDAPASTSASVASRRARARAPLSGSAAIAASRDAWLVSESDPLASPQVVSVAMDASDPLDRLEDHDIEALSDLLGAYGGWNG